MITRYFGACLVALVGCGGATAPAKAPEKCAAQTITVSVLASDAINRTAQGEPRPVVVRLYRLKSDARMYNASFEQIWKNDKAALEADLESVSEVEAYPGTRADVTFERPPAVNHLAAVALFSSPRGKRWVTTLDLPPLPEQGKCGLDACAPDDDECRAARQPKLHVVYWVDQSTVDDGVEHLDDFPNVGKMRPKAARR